ncbi:helicase POLQ-like [Littorina saxatilis]|uniref:Helicase POLQ-like n=1 Tax=Littorina saxatilis TaxID=31220 RepID=A0AAN9BTG6_9CAEN
MDSDCLISRRNRHSARNRLAEAHSNKSTAPVPAKRHTTSDSEGWIENSFSRQACHLDPRMSPVKQCENNGDFNNSDLWLAEVNLSSTHHEEQSNSHHTITETSVSIGAPIKSSAGQLATNKSTRDEFCHKTLHNGKVACKSFCDSENPLKLNCDDFSHTKLCFSPQPCSRKVSSPMVGVVLRTSSPLPTCRQPAANLGDILNFSGDADLFNDSLTEGLSDTVPESEEAEGLPEGTALSCTESFRANCEDKIPVETGNVKTFPNQDPLQNNQTGIPSRHEFHQKHNEGDHNQTSSKKENFPTSKAIPLETKPPQTPRTPACMSLKDRLKSRLLQNAANVTPTRNHLEEQQKEKISKAQLEASQIRREGLADGIGPFYGLPSKVHELLSANRKITKLYDWQDECLKLPAVYEGGNLIYTLPTSGGKTLVAEILILRQILCKKKDALLILPYIAIVQEKVRILSEFATELGFLVEEYAGSKGRFPPTKPRQKHSLFVATIEKGQSLVNCLIENGRLGELGLVVVDELHMIGEGGSRGATMESTMLKVLNATNESPQIIGMSATLNNIADLATFLNAAVFSSDFRPVSLTEYVKVEDSLYQVNNKALVPEDKLQHDKILTFPHTEQSGQMDPDHLLHLVLEIIPDNSCLLFCPTKRYCENVALMLAKMMCKHHRQLSNVQKEKRRALLQELHTDGGGKLCPTLRYTIHFGLAYHHSGLTTDERRLIEDAYSDGVLCLLTCTSTLAAGVNLPAKRVILRSPYVGADFIKHSQYKQMAGRAGRAGIDSSGESILIAKKADMPKVMELLSGPQDVCHSSLMYQSGKGLRTLILSIIGLKCVETTEDVFGMMRKTLLAVQAEKLSIDIIASTRLALQELLDKGLVVQKKTDSTTSDDILHVAQTMHAAVQGASSQPATQESLKATPKDLLDDLESQDLFEERDVPKNKRQRVDRNTELPGSSQSMPGGDVHSKANGCVSSQVCPSLSSLKLEVTELGKATFKGSVDIESGSRLYQDLLQGEESLVVSNYLHLLYLVTPYDLAKDITPSWMTYMQEVSTLEENELKVASLVGVSESYIVRKASGQSIRKKVDMLVVQRFYLTLMLYRLWKQDTVWDVAERFQLPRGFVQNLLSSAASFASCVLRFCQELPELWAYQDLLGNFGKRLAYCVSMELIPLMEVPGVKLGRARQLHSAGFHTIQSLAAADPGQLVSLVQFLTHKAARQIVSAAKVILEEKTEALMEQVEQLVPLPPQLSTLQQHVSDAS